VRVQGIIFDFDGTLADTIPLCCGAFREVAQRHLGRDYTDDEIVAMFGPSEVGIFQRIAGDSWQVCLDDFLAVYERDHRDLVTLFSGMSELLTDLVECDIPVGIVTGKGPDSAAMSLRLLDLEEHFDIVESGSPEGSVKPEAIRRIVKRWDIDPETVAYVGDAPNDVSEARAAGVIPLAAAWATTADRAALEAREPAALFTSVAELADWIR
jgi:phosphoglycolate phosphatase-like HAD superfamily hydrolase